MHSSAKQDVPQGSLLNHHAGGWGMTVRHHRENSDDATSKTGVREHKLTRNKQQKHVGTLRRHTFIGK